MKKNPKDNPYPTIEGMMSVRNDWWMEPKKNDVCGWLMWNAEIPADEFSPRYNCTIIISIFCIVQPIFILLWLYFLCIILPSCHLSISFLPCFVLLFRINKLLSSNFILFKTFLQRKFYWFKREILYQKMKKSTK